MRGSAPALVAVLLSLGLTALSSPASAQTCTCAGGGSGASIVADEAPPPLPDYEQPPIPASGYLWTPGYWAWNTYDYYWVPGTWVEPPQRGLLWTPGYWAVADGVYGFHPGYWGPHVGFYGGVAYGFGYTGAGYEGGYWNGDRLFYNRTVNNFGSVTIETIYEKPTPANASSARASFNGPGGIVAKPTAQDEELAHEKHVPPTRGQIDHARTASMTTELFNSANHGAPSIAATTKPAAFTGPGVVRGRPGGGAPLRRVNEPSGGEPSPGAPSPEPTRTVPPSPASQKNPPSPETTGGKLPPAPVEQRREPRPATAPSPEPPRPPAAAEPSAGKPPAGIERQNEERREPGEKDKRIAPGEGTNAGKPNPPPGPAAGRPPLPKRTPGEREKCGEVGEPKCP